VSDSRARAEQDELSADGGPSSSAPLTTVTGGGQLVSIPIVANQLSFDESLAAEAQKLDELADTG